MDGRFMPRRTGWPCRVATRGRLLPRARLLTRIEIRIGVRITHQGPLCSLVSQQLQEGEKENDVATESVRGAVRTRAGDALAGAAGQRPSPQTPPGLLVPPAATGPLEARLCV